jgi:hypothetical protein
MPPTHHAQRRKHVPQSIACRCAPHRRNSLSWRPRSLGSRTLRIPHPTEAARLIGSGLHRMQTLASFEPPKFRSEGRSSLCPWSRSGPPPPPTFVSPRGPVLGTRAYKARCRRFGGSLEPPAPSLASTCPRPPRRSRPLQPAVADRCDENPRSHSGKLSSCADKNQAAATANPTERKRKLPQSRTQFDPLPNSAVTPSKATAPTAAKPRPQEEGEHQRQAR